MFKRNDELRFKVGDKVRHTVSPNCTGYVLKMDKDSDHPYYIKTNSGLEMWFREDVWAEPYEFNIGDEICNNGIVGTLKEFSDDAEYPFIVELKNGIVAKFKSHGWKLGDLFSVGDTVKFVKNTIGVECDVDIGEELTIHEIETNDSRLEYACVDKFGHIYWFSKDELEIVK